MDFSLSDEQIELQNLARQILGDQTTNEHLRDIEAGDERFDEKLWADLAEAGLLGIAIGEEQGGMALGYESLCLLVEEVGRSVAPAPVIPVLVSAGMAIDRFGTDEQKQRLLPGVVSGETMLSAALIEPLNEDPERPLARAKVEGEGVVLDGIKTCVPFANRAERIVMAAQQDGGVGLFLVDPQAEGVALARQNSTAGEPQFEVRLDAAHVASNDILAGPEEGARVLHWISQRTAAANCMMAAGVVDRMTRMTAEYTAEREQFGVKIATFQAVGQRAANCYIDSECLRLLAQQAVSLLNEDRPADDEVTIAKMWVGDVTHRVSHAAQHLHGGIGVDRDYPLFRYCLWAKQLELAMGSTAQLTARLGEGIAREFSANA
ncbi:MAG: acyl-CoA dehydrogenase family protein [Myxococcota bacterium]|jgi:alkylation response protein AidB-like acyl-CoA dehydrogenase|nr:acyl-CoA dehydrogenase family protein [Myxococcota bacterium]